METPLASPSTGETGAEQIASLRAELDKRDATIDLLARQLEEAANRLDWLSRCGSEKDSQSSAKPAEGHAVSGEPTDRLDQFLQQWEGVELGESLERIDRRISHVFELLKSMESGGALAPSNPNRSSASSAPRAVEVPAEPVAGSLLTAFLLSQSTGSASQDNSQSATHSVERGEVSTPETSHADICPLPLPDFTPPQVIELESATAEELRAALIERDECIQQLLARSRMAEANRTCVPDWKSLANAPEDLRERVAQLELDLQQRIKQEELSSSIERAKLFRDRVHLDQVRKELESQIRKFGELQQVAPSAAQDGDNKASGKRWSKMFGR